MLLLTLRHDLAGCGSVTEILDGVQHRDPPSASTVASLHQRRVPWELTWFLKAASPGTRRANRRWRR